MFGIKFIKVQPTTYLLQYRRGKIVREGAGLSFFYYSPTTSLVAVPVASTDTPFIFQETTADFQTVTIQGQVTYRVSAAKQLASLLNYTLKPDGETYVSEDPDKLPERVIHVINVLARAELQKLPLREAIRASDEVVKTVKAGLVGSQEIASLGLEVLGLSILAIKPTPETARALEAETRENLFREADEAIYARRNSAVEQERAIKENELNTEIAVEQKKRQVRESQMAAEIAVEQQRTTLVAAKIDNERKESESRAEALKAILEPVKSVDWRTLVAVSSGIDSKTMISLAFQQLAENAGKIGELNVSPELLTTLLRPSRHDGKGSS